MQNTGCFLKYDLNEIYQNTTYHIWQVIFEGNLFLDTVFRLAGSLRILIILNENPQLNDSYSAAS